MYPIDFVRGLLHEIVHFSLSGACLYIFRVPIRFLLLFVFLYPIFFVCPYFFRSFISLTFSISVAFGCSVGRSSLL